MRHPNTIAEGQFAMANPYPANLKIRRDATAADVLTAFEAFKAENDARLKEIEKRGAADPLTVEKQNRIDTFMTDVQAQLNELAKRAARPGAPAADGGEQDKDAVQYRSDFHAYMRRGAESDRLQKRAMSVSDNSQGGYFASVEVDTEIAKLSRTASPVREIATVSQSMGTWKKRISKSNNDSGWVGEQQSRTETQSTDFHEVTITPHEIYANVYATQNLLDDASINLDSWIAEETNAEFVKQEGAAFVTGNGIVRPFGLIPPSALRTLEDDSTFAAHGKLGFLKTGSTSALQASASEAADRIIALQMQLRDQYQANARFVMNRFTLREVRKLKDSTNQYIWQAGAQNGAPATILGKPYTILDDMPSIASAAVVMLYGDFRQYYRIVDRTGVRILRDPFSSKPYVQFYVTKRVGGAPVITEAAKGLVCSA